MIGTGPGEPCRYLERVAGLLWPVDERAGGRTLFVLPNARRPRMLLPVRPGRVAAAAFRHTANGGAGVSGIAARAVSAALRVGVAPLLLRDRLVVSEAETIETYLRDVLDRDLFVSVYVGPPRANRKPVLHLLTREGKSYGFAKIGIDPLTRSLVRAEAEALRSLRRANLRAVTLARVLHAGQWRGLEVLVQEALPVSAGRADPNPARLVEVMREIAEVDGFETTELKSSYWQGLRDRLDAIDSSAAGRLREITDQLAERTGHFHVRLGAWHGDFAPWNIAILPHTTVVWDWERFARGVPVGFDALHFALQNAVVRHRVSPDVAARRCLGSAPSLLAPFGVDRAEARVTGALYLVEIATRYIGDGQASGPRLGRPGEWAVPALADYMSER